MAPSVLRGRIRPVRLEYDDAEHPERVTRQIPAPEWTEDDRSLLLALAEHESTLCPGCGQPKHMAWHSHLEGFYDPTRAVCHACTALQGQEVAYSLVELDEAMTPERLAAMPPFVFGETTDEPTKSARDDW